MRIRRTSFYTGIRGQHFTARNKRIPLLHMLEHSRFNFDGHDTARLQIIKKNSCKFVAYFAFNFTVWHLLQGGEPTS